ncbi:aminotransferase class I/II-fold pyridoxal phosphate-dependent enzyme [Baekduia soli]|uniref:Aminotransferase n=1 Tax=Baekduia soli TaxID=496014 RepID=A0A5B8U9N5_9ACTN|nr:aminotransferase class I/II-fold pyridoxal phosphate-dependent enzyme [Baekduia soli]QEC49780.1 aminotransferase class I/II-fold pyridoxal phosphate-dependent enzyme [Baekduia soli]
MSSIALAHRMARLGTESAFETLARARALEATGRHVTHLEIGEPGFPTPENVVEAGIRALREGHTHYVPSAGLPEARAAIAETFTATRGVAADPAQVIVTPGAKPIMFFAILALVGPGDEVVLPDPGFPIYRSMVEFAGGVARPYALDFDRGHDADPSEIAALVGPATRLVILNSPGNPTGSSLSRAALEQIAEVVARQDRCTVLSDEIYRGLAYDAEPASITEIDGMVGRTIVLDGLSKMYAMTGWRAGWGSCPPRWSTASSASWSTRCRARRRSSSSRSSRR